jgi:hypothetical protein
MTETVGVGLLSNQQEVNMLKLVTGLVIPSNKKQPLNDAKPKKGNMINDAKPIDPKTDPGVKTKKVYLK